MTSKTSFFTSDLTSVYARGYGAPSRFTNTRVPHVLRSRRKWAALWWERFQAIAKAAPRRVNFEENAVGLRLLDAAADAAVTARARKRSRTDLYPIDGSDHRDQKEWVLRFSSRFLRAGAAGVAAAAVLAVGASSAVAAPASFAGIASGSSAFLTLSGSVTVSFAGSSTTCTISTASSGGQVGNGGSPLTGWLQIAYPSGGPCANGGYFRFQINGGLASKSGSVFSISEVASGALGTNPFYSAGHPYYNWYTTPWTGGWVNGSGATPSRLTFNNTTVGTASSIPLQLTGSINVSKQGVPALLTLQ